MEEKSPDYYTKKISELERKLAYYEEDGPARLYYALSRKASEMAEMLNNTKLSNINIEDPKDKTFERLRAIIKDGSEIATAVKALGEAAGISGNESADTSRKRSFLDKFAN